jgi:SAM-dependent methyltransferase
MRTRISEANPFSYNRYGFLWEVLHHIGPGRHLDYGAYDGRVLGELSRTGVIREGIGLDVNRDVVSQHQGALPANVRLCHIEKHAALPFPDGAFDSASMLDVLEHVHDQTFVLSQLHRVLKDDGYLVVTVPRRHVFSFLDTSNLKFRFPRLHETYHRFKLRESRDVYHARYRAGRDGMIGDIESEKRWHQNFTEEELGALLAGCGFTVAATDGSALFSRPFILLKALLPRGESLLSQIDRADARRFHAANLFCVAQKCEAARPQPRLTKSHSLAGLCGRGIGHGGAS